MTNEEYDEVYVNTIDGSGRFKNATCTWLRHPVPLLQVKDEDGDISEFPAENVIQVRASNDET